MATATEAQDCVHAWPEGTRFYHTDDGRHFVVCVDVTATPEGSRIKVRRQQTMILYTDETGYPLDMLADFTSAPGTDHETAITEAGFTIGAQ